MVRELFNPVRTMIVGRRLLRRGPALAVLAAGAVALGPVGPANATSVVALWNMNETPGSRVLVDSGPNHIGGTIGTSITLNGSFHSFPQVQRGFNGATFDTQHLDVVNDPRMNPGTADFRV